MRIGILSESYEPVVNGVAVSVSTLVHELRRLHHRVCILAPHYPDHKDESPFVMRVPSILTPLNSDYAVPYPWFPRLKKQIRNLELDILHSQSPWFLGLLAVRIARRQGIAHVSTYHTLYEQYIHYAFFLPTPASRQMLKWWMPEFYNQCQAVIVPSKMAERSLRNFKVTAPIVVIPTGVSLPDPESLTDAARTQAREQFGIPAGAPMLLYVGRVAREKNIDQLLESFAPVAAEFPDARLLAVGSGPLLDHYRALAKRRGIDRVTFAGGIPRDQLDPVFAAADLFVFPSVTETQGLVVAEARAAGTPSVVVNEGGASEGVVDGEDGIIVNPGSAEISAAVRSLLLDREQLAAMRTACLRNAVRNTPAAMAERVIKVYEAALAAGQTPETEHRTPEHLIA